MSEAEAHDMTWLKDLAGPTRHMVKNMLAELRTDDMPKGIALGDHVLVKMGNDADDPDEAIVLGWRYGADGRKWLELRGLRDDVMPWWQVAADEVRHA